jgi:hypothetical protein
MSRIRNTHQGLGSALVLLLVLGLGTNAFAQIQYERFAGRLADKSGNPLVGTVIINKTQKSTAQNGSFELYVPYSERYVIQTQKVGYVPLSIIHTGQSLEELDLRISKAESFVLSPGQPINVMDSRGTKLVIPANSMVDSMGKVATVPLTLSLYTYDLRNEQMVGDMTAIDSTGQQVALESIGAFSADFTDSTGKRYNLAPGAKASISMQVDPGNDFSGPVPLWWYDHTRGMWIEEGLGTVQDGVATGEVGHFSLWNFDIKRISPACLKITVDPMYFYTYPTPGGKLKVTVTVPSPWSRTAGGWLPNPGPHTFINLPPNTNVSVNVNDAPYAIVNTGAPWGGTGFPPHPYDVCNGVLKIDATPKVAKLEGKVFRQHRSTHGGVKVVVYNINDGTQFSAITDSAGFFSVAVPPGTYVAKAWLLGYVSAKSTSTVAVSAGSTTTLSSVMLPAGDVDGDGCVTWAGDVQPIGNAVGTSVSSTDPRDINGNKTLDWDDVSKASANGGLCGPVSW